MSGDFPTTAPLVGVARLNGHTMSHTGTVAGLGCHTCAVKATGDPVAWVREHLGSTVGPFERRVLRLPPAKGRRA